MEPGCSRLTPAILVQWQQLWPRTRRATCWLTPPWQRKRYAHTHTHTHTPKNPGMKTLATVGPSIYFDYAGSSKGVGDVCALRRASGVASSLKDGIECLLQRTPPSCVA